MVATTESLITNRENDFSWLNAIRRAMKLATFKRHGFNVQK